MTLQKLDLGVERELRAQTLPISAAHEYCLSTNFGPERMMLCGVMGRRLLCSVMPDDDCSMLESLSRTKIDGKGAVKRFSTALMKPKHAQTAVLMSTVDVQTFVCGKLQNSCSYGRQRAAKRAEKAL